ncbi:MAG: hypothetical protein HY331_14315 [Chloroflexi bacterium]|nr:hypothetical protein [Chloroflexota bacterium]
MATHGAAARPALPGDAVQILPSGWLWTTIGELAQVNPGHARVQDLPNDLPVTFVPMAAVEAEQGTIAAPVERALSAVRRGFTPFVEADVIWAKITPCMENGKAAVARGLKNGLGFGSTEFHVLRSEPGILPEWLFHFVRQASFRESAKRSFVGAVGQQRVPASFIRVYPIPLAPTAEQHRIVAEIEKHLTRLGTAVTALKRAQTNLRRYRASVLKAACEGRLVPQDPNDEPASELLKRILADRRARWEAEQQKERLGRSNPWTGDGWKRRYQEATGVDSTCLAELPSGWVWATLSQLSWDAGYGTSQRCDYGVAGPPVLRIPNVSGGKIDTTDLKRAVHADGFDADESVRPDDLLVIRTNGSKELIGRSALVRDDMSEPHFYASYLIRFRLVGLAGVASWVATLWDAPVVREQVVRGAATTAGQYNVNLASLSGLAIPLAPLAEQQRIVNEVKRRLSVTKELDAVVEANLKRAERLRQSILKRAFEGRLVPQDPADEQASVLLERGKPNPPAPFPAREGGARRGSLNLVGADQIPASFPAGEGGARQESLNLLGADQIPASFPAREGGGQERTGGKKGRRRGASRGRGGD